MDLNVLRNFISVVAAGNITTASEVIHVAQPTLSKQLRHLESYYGAKLILTAAHFPGRYTDSARYHRNPALSASQVPVADRW